MQTIITQDGRILNYQYLREIALYDAKDKKGNLVYLISAKNGARLTSDEENDDINLAVYKNSGEGEKAYQKLITAFTTGREIYSFADDTPVSVLEHDETSEKTEPEKPSYKNRFINKDKDR